MEREGLINGTCAKICELKAELARIQETIAGLYTSLNGLQGDGSGNLQIIGGSGVGVETLDGNRVKLTAGVIDIDPEPTSGSTAPVQSGGTYDMITNVGTAVNPVARATTAALADSVPASGVSGVLPIEHGGTGSATKNFVDLNTTQIVQGVKNFQNPNATVGEGSAGIIRGFDFLDSEGIARGSLICRWIYNAAGTSDVGTVIELRGRYAGEYALPTVQCIKTAGGISAVYVQGSNGTQRLV